MRQSLGQFADSLAAVSTPVDDPNWLRRRKLLNILVMFEMFFALIGFVSIISSPIAGDPEGERLFTTTLLGLALITVTVWLNRARNNWLPGLFFVAVQFVFAYLSDSPYEIVFGRSQLTWFLPVIISSIVLPPAAALATAVAAGFGIALTSLFILQGYTWGDINLFTIVYLFFLAGGSWISARALETALTQARRDADYRRIILDGIADGVLVLDGSHRIQLTNPALRDMLPEDELRQFLETWLSSNEAQRIEVGKRVFSVSSSPIETGSGQIGCVAIIRDETRREEVERAKDALLATTSHELRTPLSAIIGFSDILLMMPAGAEIHNIAQRISVAGKRLKNMVNGLLDHAQIQAGSFRILPAPVQPSAIADDLRSLMAGLAKDKGLDFVVQVNGVPAQVIADADRLQQVLVNLTANAIKFTDNGSVQVHMYAVDTQNWGISVADTGDGIPTEQLPDIFEPFRRASNYATRTRQGAGLGLSISRQLVRLMGGTITVQSKVGEGSTFQIQLPIGSNQ
jgi:signal transduction histidine kinase